jgi:hypothetical protein
MLTRIVCPTAVTSAPPPRRFRACSFAPSATTPHLSGAATRRASGRSRRKTMQSPNLSAWDAPARQRKATPKTFAAVSRTCRKKNPEQFSARGLARKLLASVWASGRAGLVEGKGQAARPSPMLNVGRSPHGTRGACHLGEFAHLVCEPGGALATARDCQRGPIG